MRLKNIFLGLALAAACSLTFTACNDDEEEIIVEPEKPELTFDADALRVKIGAENKAQLPIATGLSLIHI